MALRLRGPPLTLGACEIETIWERGEALRYTRERTVDDLWGFCRGCYYAETCMAGCTWASHVILGRPGNNPYCYHRAATLRTQGKRERMVPLQAARGVPFERTTTLDLPTRAPSRAMPAKMRMT